MAQVAEIKFEQKVMEKETERKISGIEGLCLGLFFNINVSNASTVNISWRRIMSGPGMFLKKV